MQQEPLEKRIMYITALMKMMTSIHHHTELAHGEPEDAALKIDYAVHVQMADLTPTSTIDVQFVHTPRSEAAGLALQTGCFDVVAVPSSGAFPVGQMILVEWERRLVCQDPHGYDQGTLLDD